MKRKIIVLMIVMAVAGAVNAATQQDIQQAIDDGLAHLAGTITTSGSEGYWYLGNNGTLSATGSAALAFIEEGYLPGNDVIIGGTNYGDVVGKATRYIFNRATKQAIGAQTMGHPEDYDNNGTGDGNGQGIYFNPGYYTRNVYTTGIVAPVVYALGEALGENTAVGMGTVSTMTYKEVMRDVIDWFSWGQVDPAYGNYRGGWRYNANWSSSDNSTAQWGSLPSLYGDEWGLATPQFVKDELKLWTDYIQNENGGSGYDWDGSIVNVSKTGGLMIQFAEMGYSLGVNNSDSIYNTIGNEVDAAKAFINSRWNTDPSGTWYGNEGHPYAMWAVYKALDTYGFLVTDPGPDGILGTADDYVKGTGMSNAAGGIEIGQDWDSDTSLAGDWYSHYCDWLVGNQNGDGSWSGYSYWSGALSAGWYINILNATGAPPPVIPVPGAFLLGCIGLAFAGRKLQRRKEL